MNNEEQCGKHAGMLTYEERYIISSLLYQIINSERTIEISPPGGHHGGMFISCERLKIMAKKLSG